MRTLKILCLALALGGSFTLSACGGGGGGGGSASNKSAVEELKGLPVELDAAVQTLLKPIDDANAITAQLGELPTKLGIAPKDFLATVKATFDGAPAPSIDGLKAESKAELDAFLARVTEMKNGIASIPDNSVALGKKVVEMTAMVPVLTTKATGELTATLANPFAAADAKKKAEEDKAGLDAVANDVSAKISATQEKITSVPGKATEAVSKFTAALVGG